jgi:hypothetical protein
MRRVERIPSKLLRRDDRLASPWEPWRVRHSLEPRAGVGSQRSDRSGRLEIGPVKHRRDPGPGSQPGSQTARGNPLQPHERDSRTAFPSQPAARAATHNPSDAGSSPARPIESTRVEPLFAKAPDRAYRGRTSNPITERWGRPLAAVPAARSRRHALAPMPSPARPRRRCRQPSGCAATPARSQGRRAGTPPPPSTMRPPVQRRRGEGSARPLTLRTGVRVGKQARGRAGQLPDAAHVLRALRSCPRTSVGCCVRGADVVADQGGVARGLDIGAIRRRTGAVRGGRARRAANRRCPERRGAQGAVQMT